MLTRPRSLTLLALVLVAGLAILPAVLVGSQETAEAMPVSPQMPHIGHIREGTCGRLVPYPLATLADMAALADASGAHPAMVSLLTPERVVYLTLDELVSDSYVVAAHYADELIRRVRLSIGDSQVACGEIGATCLPDGSLVIALREQNASGYGGIAHLAPNPGVDGQMLMTLVTIYLVPPMPDALPPATPEHGWGHLCLVPGGVRSAERMGRPVLEALALAWRESEPVLRTGKPFVTLRMAGVW